MQLYRSDSANAPAFINVSFPRTAAYLYVAAGEVKSEESVVQSRMRLVARGIDEHGQ